MLAPHGSRQQREYQRVVHMGVKPQALQALFESAVRPQSRRRPGTLARALGHATHQQRRRPATMAEQDVKLRVAVEHAAVDQRSYRQRLLGGETCNDVQIEAFQCRVARGTVDPCRTGVDRQGHVQLHGFVVQHIECWRVQCQPRVGAKGRTDETEFGYRTAQFLSRRFGCLQGHRSESRKTLRMPAHDGCQSIVVHPAITNRVRLGDEMEIRQRVGRQHLEVDAPLGHAAQPQLHIHERAAHITHAVEPVICTNLEERHAVRILTDEGTKLTGGTHGLGDHHMRMQVDYAGRSECAGLHKTVHLV